VNLDLNDPLFVNSSEVPIAPSSASYPVGSAEPSSMSYYPNTRGHDNSVINGIGRIGFMAGGKSALWDDESMADVFVEEMKHVIAANKQQPFFLYFSSQDIHVPRTPHPRFRRKSSLSYRGDAMVQLDWSVGQILKTLEEHGLEENTVVIFTSDNGPVYDDGYVDGTTIVKFDEEIDRGHDASGPYRGGKYSIHEGGTRVPFIIRWPARIEPGVSNALVNQIDLLASFAGLLDSEIPVGEAADSQNTLEAFLGEDRIGRLEMLEESWQLALRTGPWKYVQNGISPQKMGRLYNLREDPEEVNDLASQSPVIAEQLNNRIRSIIDSHSH